eukprot:TRINITY_DN18029_c0_g1_i1.p2 TRINITY_DN18029_c0_g1~~TRINITY_DN18029_c0_g1_i1.p2  ORF type:complete len:249 (+),score=-32.26 TRINITY_DN18029_c0_g1_i1:58-804(+)
MIYISTRIIARNIYQNIQFFQGQINISKMLHLNHNYNFKKILDFLANSTKQVNAANISPILLKPKSSSNIILTLLSITIYFFTKNFHIINIIICMPTYYYYKTQKIKILKSTLCPKPHLFSTIFLFGIQQKHHSIKILTIYNILINQLINICYINQDNIQEYINQKRKNTYQYQILLQQNRITILQQLDSTNQFLLNKYACILNRVLNKLTIQLRSNIFLQISINNTTINIYGNYVLPCVQSIDLDYR